MICSLTKAAAHEISGRGIPIADDMVGTLHAHCFRSLGAPALAESNLKQWNEEFPHYAMKGGQTTEDATDSDADSHLNIINTERAKLTPYDQWPENVKMFHKKWEEWKESNGFMDFTDMIDVCIENGGAAHGEPSIMLGDEAQDWSKLEFKLFVDTWGKHADTIVLAADFDQSIFSFRGCDPHYFQNNPVPPENKKVREQSFRVPRRVHARAREWIRRISNREDVNYHPTDREGTVQTPEISLRDNDELIEEIQARVSDGKSVMVLVSCAYMLRKLISAMREQGMPFCNNYRREQGAWNPLARRQKATMPVDRITSFLAPEIHKDEEWRGKTMRKWTEDEFKAWATALPATVFRYGIKTKIAGPFFRIPEAFGEYNLLFREEDDAHKSLFMDIEWYKQRLSTKYSGPVGYACEVARRYGMEGITKTPLVTVGTIHSVKGGEADSVFLFPDLSRDGMQGLHGSQEEADNIVRQFYVGMTRAREELILCAPSSKLAVDW